MPLDDHVVVVLDGETWGGAVDYVSQRLRRAFGLKPKRPEPDAAQDPALALQRIRDIAKAEELFGHCTDPRCTAKQAIKEIATLLRS